MKTYNRKTKKWETKESSDPKLKKRETCKGGRRHDWVRVLPFYVEALDNYQGDVEPYYAAKKAIHDFSEQKYEELKAIGIYVRESKWTPREYREEICSICKKQQYVDLK